MRPEDNALPDAYRRFDAPVEAATVGAPTRALVLGGGGATGVGWFAGFASGIAEAGIDLSLADTMVGTSAGSIAATHLRLGNDLRVEHELMESGEPIEGIGRFRAWDIAQAGTLLVRRNGPKARRMLGRISRRSPTMSQDRFIDVVAGPLRGTPWPQGRLLLTAVDVTSGASVVFDGRVPLERAVAASCSVPGLFPPITIDGRDYMDGGMRSPGNVDLAAGHDRVLVLVPITVSAHGHTRPLAQAQALAGTTRHLVIAPDKPARQVMGYDPMDNRRAPASVDAGHAQALRWADRVRELWT